MALELYIPPCISTSGNPLHPPPLEQPLRIQIEGLLVSIQKLPPEVLWRTDVSSPVFPQPAGPQPAGPELARLAYQKIYGHEVRPDVAGDMIVRDEYLGWVTGVTPLKHIDYYGVTFDHLVPADNPNPKVLQINIIEMDNDGGGI
ncbi:hypothetical protein B0O99DRAFT_628272, partial [Bisporella sp. PMI_857]